MKNTIMGIRLDEFLEKQIWKTYGAVSTPIEIIDLMLQVSVGKSGKT